MAYLYTLLTLILVFTVGCGGATAVKPRLTPTGPSFLDSVRPIQVRLVDLDENSSMMNKLRASGRLENANVGETRNICTISSIDQERHYWITAAHCLAEIGQEGRYIEGSPIVIVEISEEMDIAVVQVDGISVPALALQVGPTTWQQDILIVGHPFGYDPVFITRGYVANPRGLIEASPYMLFNVAAAPGNSGSPVLNLNGEIVSILQIGWGESFSPVTGGATYGDLQHFAQYFQQAADTVLFEGILTRPVLELWE